MAALARHLAHHNLFVVTPTLPSANLRGHTVQYLVDNRPFLDALTDRLVAELPHVWRATGGNGPAPRTLLLCGHSAGGDAVAHAAAHLVVSGVPPAGVLLLDPVGSARGDNLRSGAMTTAAAGVPIRCIAAPPSRCNNGGSGVKALEINLPGFLGVRLSEGSHVDAEAGTSDRMAAWLCGSPRPAAVSHLRELAVTWLHGMVTGSDLGPTSALVSDLVSTRQGERLWGQAGSTSPT